MEMGWRPIRPSYAHAYTFLRRDGCTSLSVSFSFVSQEFKNLTSHYRLLRQTETVGCARHRFFVTLGNRHTAGLRSQECEYKTDCEEASCEEQEGGQHCCFGRRRCQQIARSRDQGEA